VAWVFAIVLDVAIFQVHEIIKKCKNHDTKWERSGVQPGPARPAGFANKFNFVIAAIAACTS
jgi:hypothetical protein